ncbi:hypothetical protein [Pseudomonas californiensis]|uniref:hypothetical protein n=1 Tax=Pseudomonas californiensis TaxID=2829823 RepID=UPI001E58CC44|nr:hypothetical protein [Pseudomonas californiensis]
MVSALRVLYESQAKVFTVNPLTESVQQVIGVSITGGSPDSEITIQTMGFIDDLAWSWTEGLVFCGPDGSLTQIPPTAGWELVVGFASSATRLNLDFDEPVLLA